MSASIMVSRSSSAIGLALLALIGADTAGVALPLPVAGRATLNTTLLPVGAPAPHVVVPPPPPPPVPVVTELPTVPPSRFPTYVKFSGDPGNNQSNSGQARVDLTAADSFQKESPFFAVGFYMPLDYATWGVLFSFGNQPNRDAGLIAASTNPPGDFVNLYQWGFGPSQWKNLAFSPGMPQFGMWSHIAIILESTSKRSVWENGLTSEPLKATDYNAALTAPWPVATSDPLSFTFGSYQDDGHHSYNGGLRDWAVVTGVPTEAELLRHRAGENPIAIWGAKRVWGFWRFNAGPAGSGKEPDASGKGHDLTYRDLGVAAGHKPPVLVGR